MNDLVESQVVQAGTGTDLTLTDPGIIAIGERAEKLVRALKMIRAAVLKLTNEKDWENLGGKPYLNEGGAKKVGAAFGVSWRLDEPKREDSDDGHFDYSVSGEFEFRGTRVEEMGTRSSRDDFFSKAKGRALPPSEIDRNDVKKSAVTNCIARGVKSVLALRNFTWEEIKAAGIEQDKVNAVDYRQESADPNAAMNLPNYGRHKGQPMNDPAIPIEELRYYLQGAEHSIADPKKAKYKASNERMRDALQAEIEKRDPAAVPASVSDSEAPPGSEVPHGGPAPSQAESQEADRLTLLSDYQAELKHAPTATVGAQKYNEAAASGFFTPQELKTLRTILDARIAELGKRK